MSKAVTRIPSLCRGPVRNATTTVSGCEWAAANPGCSPHAASQVANFAAAHIAAAMRGQRGSDCVVPAIRNWAICAGTAEQHDLGLRDARLGHG